MRGETSAAGIGKRMFRKVLAGWRVACGCVGGCVGLSNKKKRIEKKKKKKNQVDGVSSSFVLAAGRAVVLFLLGCEAGRGEGSCFGPSTCDERGRKGT